MVKGPDGTTCSGWLRLVGCNTVGYVEIINVEFQSCCSCIFKLKQTLDIITSTTLKAYMVGKMAQDEGMVQVCCSVVPTLFGFCLRIPS